MKDTLIDEKSSEYRILNSLLEEGETVGIEIAEHRLGGAKFLDPAHAYATNWRVIIVRGGVLLGMGSDFKLINYKNITEIKLERGIKFCRLHFSVEGESSASAERKWLVGLDYNDALNLVHFVNKMGAKPVEEKKVN